MKPVSLEVVEKTDTGLVKRRNEDATSIALDQGLIILADGMGGANAGDIASRLAVEIMSETLRAQLEAMPLVIQSDEVSKTSVVEMLKISVDFTNRVVHSTSKQFKACTNMGTTLISCLFFKDWVAISNVGDSRVYLFRDKILKQLTCDHTYIKETKDMSGEVHVSKFLTKAVGLLDKVEADFNVVQIKAEDIYLVCTDGLTDMVNDELILSSLLEESKSLEEHCQSLMENALNHGGKDNVTIILIKVL